MVFSAPMTMRAFFNASAGMWLIRRVVHHFDHQDDEAGDSNLIIEPFGLDDPIVQRICDTLNTSVDLAAGGSRFWWQSNLKVSETSDDNAAVVIDLPNPNNPREGLLLRDKGYVEKLPVTSRYVFSDDGLLSITTRYSTNVGVERCWFVSDDVRFRASSVQLLDGVSMATYCTEIRCHSDIEASKLRGESEAFFLSHV